MCMVWLCLFPSMTLYLWVPEDKHSENKAHVWPISFEVDLAVTSPVAPPCSQEELPGEKPPE